MGFTVTFRVNVNFLPRSNFTVGVAFGGNAGTRLRRSSARGTSTSMALGSTILSKSAMPSCSFASSSMDLPGAGRTPICMAKASAASLSALLTSMAVASQSSLMTPSASFFSVTFINSVLLLREEGRLMRPVRFARYSSTARAHKIEAHRVHRFRQNSTQTQRNTDN